MRRYMTIAALLLAIFWAGSGLAKPPNNLPPNNQQPPNQQPPNQLPPKQQPPIQHPPIQQPPPREPPRPLPHPPQPRPNPPPVTKRTPPPVTKKTPPPVVKRTTPPVTKKGPPSTSNPDWQGHRQWPSDADHARAALERRIARAYAYSRLYPYGIGYPYEMGYDNPYGVPGYYYYTPYPMPMYMPFGPVGGWDQGVPQGMGPNGGIVQQPGFQQPPQPADDEAEPEPERRPNLRSTNARSNALAWKYIGYGDGLYGKQRYAEAADRYRRAVGTAPQLADGWFRRALALTGTGRYDQAVSAVKRGLAIDPKWPAAAFDAGDTLWPDAKAKDAYFSTLTKLAAEHPADPNVLFLVGLHFRLDGQDDQAKKYLTRAQRIAGRDGDHIEAFMR